MAQYGEKSFVQALIPLLISRLPDPFSPSEADVELVEKCAFQWAELLSLRQEHPSRPAWMFAILDDD